MSERKVLNKYYPPDFDPSKLPRIKRSKNRQFTIRLMAPCNMRCKTCGEYIYKGKKFNARKEDVMGSDYLGIQIYRFYIKCTKCLAEITFKTDPANSDYELEHGAIRMFESVRLAEKKLKEEVDALTEQETGNPMKLLENRTRDSKKEIASLEELESLQQRNARNAGVDLTALTDYNAEYTKILARLQDEEDERLVREAFGPGKCSHLITTESDDDDGTTNTIDDDSPHPDPPAKPVCQSDMEARKASGGTDVFKLDSIAVKPHIRNDIADCKDRDTAQCGKKQTSVKRSREGGKILLQNLVKRRCPSNEKKQSLGLIQITAYSDSSNSED